MARRVNGLDLPTGPGKAASVTESDVEIDWCNETPARWTNFARCRIVLCARPAADRCSRLLAELCCPAAVVAVTVRDKNVGNDFAFERVRQHLELLTRFRAWIDDRNLAFSHHVEIGAFESKKSGILADDPAKTGRNAL